jgi:DNA polymerase
MSWVSATKKTRKIAEALVPKLAPTFSFKPAEIDWDRLVTLDFETFYDTDYTLKKLSTSEYVRDPRFKAQMVGIKIGRNKTKIYGPKQMAKAIKSINWATHSLLCHNVQFDGFILSHHFGVVPAKYHDTLGMARGLHSNEIGASLDEVAQFYGKGSKIEGALESTKGVLDWPKALYDATALYCAQDVDLTFEIFKEMHVKYPPSELELIHMTARMFCNPVLRVDIPRVQAEYEREVAERKALMLSVINPREYDDKTTLKTRAERELEGEERDMLIVKRVVGSNEKFADLLKVTGLNEYDVPHKVSPAYIKKSPAEKALVPDDEKYVYAFAKDDLEFINLPDRVWELFPDLDPNDPGSVLKASALSVRLQQLVDARISVKSTTNITRAERFLEAGKDGMPLPVGYAYYRAHTGRWGGNNKMNMQNLTRGGELRLSILAAAGHVMCVADSGQIEARVNGWLWDQDDLLDGFRDKRDIYSEFATDVYLRTITKADKNERHVGKVCVLGLGYQMGAPKLQMTLAKGALGGPPIALPLEECHRIVNIYRRKNFKIASGWKICSDWIEHMANEHAEPIRYKCLEIGFEYIRLPNGMCLKYPDLKQSRGDKGWDEWSYQSGDMRKKIYGGLLTENLVQALARIIVAEQMLMIDKKYPVVMTTHDEAVAHPKKKDGQKCYDFMEKCMTTPMWWCSDIPLAAEGGFADNYSK